MSSCVAGMICSVYGCKNYTWQKNSRSLFRFPKDKDVCRQWVHKSKRTDLDEILEKEGPEKLYNGNRICDVHFREEDFRNLNNKSQGLKRGSIPSLMLPTERGTPLRPAPRKRNVEVENNGSENSVEFECCPVKQEHVTNMVPMLLVKEELSDCKEYYPNVLMSFRTGHLNKEESNDDNCNMLSVKLEPKDEVTVEEHCISLGDGSGGSPKWSSDEEMLDQVTCITEKSLSLSSPESSRMSANDNDRSYFLGNHATQQKYKKTKGVVFHRLGIHCGKKKNKCAECGKYFSKSSNLKEHLKIHSGEKDYKCAECGKCFTQNSNLRQHLKIHSGGKDYECEKCGKCFTQSSNLREHLKIHSGDRSHKCTECGKRFTRGSNLKQHIQIHSGNMDHKCEECGKCFTKRGTLRTHLMIHSGEKVHKCEECEKCFIWRSHLRDHLKIHSGEKDHKCAACGKCFTHSCNLRQHLKIHSGEKNHKCTVCGKCFTTSSTLKTHLKIHFGNKDHKCAGCGKCYTQGSHLRQHLRVHCGLKHIQAEENKLLNFISKKDSSSFST